MTEGATADPTPPAETPPPAQEPPKQTWEELFKDQDPAKVKEALDNSRKWEQRAKENKTAADQLAAIEEANKTEAQKAADRLAAAEKAAADATREALKFKIAAKFQIGDEDADLFLTGSDEDSMTKQAQRLMAREADRKKAGNYVPSEGSRVPNPSEDSEAQFARNLFSPTS